MSIKNVGTQPIAIGRPVALHEDPFGVVLARADDLDAECYGIAASSGRVGGPLEFRRCGDLVSGDWTSATGSRTLTPGARYYLSAASAGQITSTPPSEVGQILQPVGVAIDPNTLSIAIGDAIQL